MKKKKLLVDLYFLKDIYRGYGQIALNYGYYFKENYKSSNSSYELYLLVPKKYIGAFGNEVKYISSNNFFTRYWQYLLPKFDVWHNLQHPSRFKPYSKETKYIFTLHDLNCLNTEYLNNKGLKFDFLEKRLKVFRTKRNFNHINKQVKRADIVVAISEFTYNQTIKEFDINDEKLKLIHNGVEDLTNKPINKPDIDIKKPFFFYISAYRDKKNFHSLLDMMKLLPQYQLYLAGNDNTLYGKMIKERIKTEKISNVCMLGRISEEEKCWMYANCKALVFPSLFEGFGLPVIEAMQFGKPVFSSKETSLLEIGGEFAYFWDDFEPNNMKQLIVDNLDAFYEKPEIAEAEKEYANSFSYSAYFNKYEKVYKSLI